MTIANGSFYIDDATDNFWLKHHGVWTDKGRLYRAVVVGFLSEAIYPFTAGQYFELAPGAKGMHFYDTFSNPRSNVQCDYPAAANCTITLTDSLSGFLGLGTNVICQAQMTPASKTATLAFNDVIVPAAAPLWLVMPATADVAMAGLRALFAGDLV